MAELLAGGHVWRGAQHASQSDVLASGFAPLDALLGGGWPTHAVTELLLDEPGRGELSLLMPLLASRSPSAGWQAWINPPLLPYAPALGQAGVHLAQQMVIRASAERDRLWAAHQTLASGACSVVLMWLPEIEQGQIRRLQLAAEKGRCCGFLIRPTACAGLASQAAVRLKLTTEAGHLCLQVLKRRGGWPGASVRLAV